MKFLCVPCDSPMKLQTVQPPEGGSLAVVYACPECGYEMAMLTNAYETQIVQSLGVRIGPGGTAAEPGPATTGSPAAPLAAAGCPFPAMIPMPREAQAAGVTGATSAGAGEPVTIRWTPAAEARLARIPEFVRPMARTGVERFARERGVLEVDEGTLDAARDFFGM